ncbi:MAG: hypothetical protein WAU58_00910 [Terriglobales bacterium]
MALLDIVVESIRWVLKDRRLDVRQLGDGRMAPIWAPLLNGVLGLLYEQNSRTGVCPQVN